MQVKIVFISSGECDSFEGILLNILSNETGGDVSRLRAGTALAEDWGSS